MILAYWCPECGETVEYKAEEIKHTPEILCPACNFPMNLDEDR